MLTLSIPLTSRQTVFTVYESKLIPMPQPDDAQVAFKWDIEGPYLAVSEDRMETAVLSEVQFEKCIGSARYRICHESIPTDLGRSSCLSTLFFFSPLEALAICDTQLFYLPNIERAENLGFGIWLITSSSDSFVFSESHTDPSVPEISTYQGCNICLISLSCGMQIATKNIKIRSDLESCKFIPPIKLQLQLPDPLFSLISEVPSVDELPYYSSKPQASIDLLRNVRKELLKSPKAAKLENLVEISKPLVAQMKMLRPSLTSKLESYVPFKVSAALTLTVTVISLLLHALAMYIYHRYHLFDKLFPTAVKTDEGQSIKIRPLIPVEPEHLESVRKQIKTWNKNAIVVSSHKYEPPATPTAPSTPSRTRRQSEPSLRLSESRESEIGVIDESST